ncbi:DsbC family protein [Undibacterium macrobrachii]|jgi:thiol:disulfide interchange protein DsbC|uniref:Thiol:disulfide interchange protein n=1 Tax=Undibacterium macrobrachii TaxID=1119058 RepID=A0ABQ2XLC8_9BURK|nr:DsbC family protein [Undibacterium macrobrachii]GGX23344.1 thiol:disulfide interchange protein DsbC [Undibacterium macrobrachii]
MKKKLISFAVAAITMVGSSVWAQTPAQIEANIKKVISSNIGSGVKIDSVTKTPYGGLYEVRMGNEIIYTDDKAKYIFVGSIIDVKGTTNFTKQRTDELNRVNFSELPLDAAVKYVKGDGKRVIAIFEDPNCGYCKKFRKTLQGVDNITIYTFMYNILSDDSVTKSRDIWCSADRSKAWDEWMMNGKVAPTAAASCKTPHDQVLALGKKYRVTGTPTVIFTDGSRLPGMVDVKALEEKFASLKTPSLAAK